MFNRPVMKPVAAIAVLAIICNLVIAPIVFAAGSPQSPPAGNPPAGGELREWRTPTSHNIRNADGSVTAEIYASPVYFKDGDGKWQEIRNRVVREGTRPGFPWRNEANSFAVSFADALGTGSALRLEVGDSWMEYGLAVSAAPSANVSGDKVRYAGVRDGVDLVYTTQPDGVEEEVVLQSAKAGNVFPFTVATNTAAALESDGSVAFYNASGGKVWFIQSLLMYDSAGAESSGLRYTQVEAHSGKVSLTLEADAAWLADPARVYPVVIDPTIVIQPDPASGMDSYVSGLQGSTSTNYGGETEIRVGNATVSGNHAVYRSLLKFNLSSIPKSLITDARLGVYKSYGSAVSARNVDFALHTVTTQWLEGEVTWAKATQATAWAAVGGDFVEQPVCTMTINADSSVGWYTSPGPESSTLASVVSSWVNGNSVNCGLLMKRVQEPSADTVQIKLRSSDYADLTLHPKLTVTYIEDTVAPTVEVLAPAAGASLSGIVTVSANATDAGEAPTGVDRVEFFVDGGLRATVAEPPYEFTWDTTVEGNGAHGIAVKAYDKAGNVGQLSQAVLLSDSFTDALKIDSELTTASVDSAVGVVRLAGTESQAWVASAMGSTTLPQPSFPLSYLSDGNTATVWKSAGKTSASGTETVTLNWSSTWSIAYVVVTPAKVADGLQAKVELLDSSGAVVETTSYQTLGSSPTYISTDRTSARSARVTFTNLTPDPISGQFHANVAEVKVLRYYLSPYYVDSLQAYGSYLSSANTRGSSATGSSANVGTHDLFYYALYSVAPSNCSASVQYAAPNSWVNFSGGSYNAVEYSSKGTSASYPNTSTHRVSWSDYDRKSGDSSSPSDWSGQAWVSTNPAGHYTDCWVSNWWAETRTIYFTIYVNRDMHYYSARVDWQGYRRDTYYQATYPAVSFGATVSEQYGFTYSAANATDGNPNTAWVSAGKTDRQSAETLDLSLAASTLINRVYVKPRMNGMSAKVYTWENSAWALRSEIPVLLEGSYSFPDTTTDKVHLEFSNLQGSNPYYAGVAEASVGYAAYSPSGLLVSRPQALSDVPDSLTLQVDDSAPVGTSIAYEVTADGVNWQVAIPGASMALQYPGSQVALRATLQSSSAWATPEIRSWRIEKPGQGLAVTVQNGGDSSPPLVSITEPAAGSTVSGLVTIRAHAWDDSGVARVLFLVDGELLGADTTSPYEASWETRPGSGSHQISVVAHDYSGNSSAIRTYNVVALADSFSSLNLVDQQHTTASVNTVSGSVSLTPAPVGGQNWPVALGEWHYRRAVSLGNSSAYDHTGEPVRVTVTDQRVKTGGADIRVTDPSGTVIAHRVVAADDVSKTYVVQFEARSVPAQSSRTYRIYFGNPDASSTSLVSPETAYEPIAPLVVDMPSYTFWQNGLYFEPWSVGVTQMVTGDDSHATVAMSFAWPYALESSLRATQRFTDFSEYATGAKPHDWTERWHPDGQWAVVEDAGATGGKLLRHSPSSDARRLLSWDAVNGSGTVEIVARVRVSAASNYEMLRLFANASGTGASDEDANGLECNQFWDQLYPVEYTNNTFTRQSSIQGYSFPVNTWFRLRFRIEGGIAYGKVWSDGSPEPAGWSGSRDLGLKNGSWAGIGMFSCSGTVDIDWCGMATGGDTAPTGSASARVADATMCVSTNGRVHTDTTDASAKVLDPAGGSAARWVSWLNSDQNGGAGAGARSASGNLPQAHKFYSSGIDSGGSTVRSGSAVLFANGRLHINVDTGRGTTGYMGNPGLRCQASEYSYWNWAPNSCYVVILDPMSLSLGALESQYQYPGSQVAQSTPVSLDQTVMTAWVSATQHTPSGTGISYDISSDGGLSWQPASPGEPCLFESPTQSITLRATLATSDPWVTPTLFDWGVTISETTNAVVTVSNVAVDPPSALTATARVGEASIDLAWAPSSTPGVTYSVYRGLTPGFPLDGPHLVATDLGSAFWVDYTCVQGTGYYYRATAILGDSESLPTNEASAISGLVEAGADRLGLEGPWAFVGAVLGGNQAYVNVATGNLVVSSTDMARSAPSLGIVIRRTYNSMAQTDLGFGYGWDLNFNYTLSEDQAGNVTLKEGDGSVHIFARNPDSTYARPAGVYMELSKLPDGTYYIVRKDGLTYSFDASGKITRISDRNGNSLLYSYTTVPGVGVRLTGITDPVGRLVTLTYDPARRLTQVADWEGRTYSYAHDVQGNLASVTDPAGNQISYRYDAYHQLTSVADKVGNETLVNLVDGKCQSIADALGQVTTFAYDPVARRTTVTDPRDNDTVFEFNQAGGLTERTDALGWATSFQYDADGNVTQLTDIWNNTWLYNYDSEGNMVEANDPSGTTTVTVFNQFNLPDQVSVYGAPDRLTLLADARFTYDASGNVLTVSDSIDAAQSIYRTTTFDYDPARPGFIDTVTDPRGSTSEYTYDVYGYPQTVTRHVNVPGGGTEPIVARTQYDSLGNLTSATAPNGNAAHYEYDLMGRPIRTVLPDGTVGSVTYDAQGRVLTQTDGNGRRTTYQYDALGRAVKVIDPLGNETALAYDDANNKAWITKPGGISTTYEYDQIGRLERALDGLGRATVYTYDATLNKVTVTDALGRWVSGTYDYRNLLTAYTNAVGTTTVAYDRLGRKTSVTDPNNKVIAYSCDDPGRLLSVTDPMGEAITYEYDASDNMTRMTTRVRDTLGQYVDRVTTYAYDELNRRTAVTLPDLQGTGQVSSSYTYDANGNQATRTDGKGQTTDYEYDSRSRLIQVRYPSGAEVSYTYDAVGNALTMRDGAGTTVYQYDALNRLTAETDAFGRTVRYSYDDVARTGTLSTDWGTITYQGNILGQLETVTDPSGGVTRYHYDLAGGCSQVDYPNGDVITCAYDGVSRLTEIKGVHGAAVISDYDYTYDTAGNRLTMTNSTGTTGYEYDGNYRLRKATRPGGSYTEYWYDEAGNRTRMTDTTGGAKTTTYAYDVNDRLTLVTHPEGTATSYEYDANGNQLRLVEPQGTTVFTYDEENRLTGIGFPTGTSVEYQYDGQGRRLRMKDPNVEVFSQYGMGQVISDRDGAGAVIAYYVRGLGGRLISNVQTAGTRYYHFDGLGSVVALTDSAGTKVSSYTYDEFGVLKQSTGQSWNNFQYTSSIHDTAPGLYLMGSRYYDPALGRFITQDTWGGNAYEPWTKNLYAYGRGNPVNYIDPTGHNPILIILAVLAKLLQSPGATELAAEALVAVGLWAYGVHTEQPLASAIEELGGTKVVGRPADEVNAELALQGYSNPPFEAGTTVFEFWTTAVIELVRVFAQGVSPKGRWLMRPEDIQGLTPEQIQSKFGLAYVPTQRIPAQIGAGFRIRIGIAGPQPELNALGGGIQIDIFWWGNATWGVPVPLVGQ